MEFNIDIREIWEYIKYLSKILKFFKKQFEGKDKMPKKELDKEMQGLIDDSRRVMKKWEILADNVAKEQGISFDGKKSKKGK